MRRRHGTTVSDAAAAQDPDLLGRDFTADMPNKNCVGDIIHLPAEGGKSRYLATVVDLALRRLAGWAIAGHLRTGLVADAPASVIRTRGSLAGSLWAPGPGAVLNQIPQFGHAMPPRGADEIVGAS
ncbi:hypothetical protein [Streptomyces albidoflavus]|uniref:hypothetical protein n=1 Tax=Streptomyces albidoflavus TaxID=1886 RepID=UPI00342A14E6